MTHHATSHEIATSHNIITFYAQPMLYPFPCLFTRMLIILAYEARRSSPCDFGLDLSGAVPNPWFSKKPPTWSGVDASVLGHCRRFDQNLLFPSLQPVCSSFHHWLMFHIHITIHSTCEKLRCCWYISLTPLFLLFSPNAEQVSRLSNYLQVICHGHSSIYSW